MASSEEIKTPLCRLSYARDLFTARAADEKYPDKNLKFGCTLIFQKTDTAARAMLEKLAADTIVAEWGPKGLERAKMKLIKTPFFAGDGPEARYKKGERVGELNPGMGPDVWFIRVSAQANRPPAVWWKNHNVQETEKTVYSGCYGKAVVNAFTSDHATGGQRVSFGISGFQKHAEGERLGGSPGDIDKEKWSETIADEGEAPAETRTGAGPGGLFGE
jgi:hypothetical protein